MPVSVQKMDGVGLEEDLIVGLHELPRLRRDGEVHAGIAEECGGPFLPLACGEVTSSLDLESGEC